MPVFTATTIQGVDIGQAVTQTSVTGIALWFTGTQIPALRYRKIGTLRLIEEIGTRRIIVREWPVIYPGIFPVFNTPQSTPNCILSFQHFRPGLAYSLFFG